MLISLRYSSNFLTNTRSSFLHECNSAKCYNSSRSCSCNRIAHHKKDIIHYRNVQEVEPEKTKKILPWLCSLVPSCTLRCPIFTPQSGRDSNYTATVNPKSNFLHFLNFLFPKTRNFDVQSLAGKNCSTSLRGPSFLKISSGTQETNASEQVHDSSMSIFFPVENL